MPDQAQPPIDRHTYIVLLVDDVRSFADGRACRVARDSATAVALLREHRGTRLDALWLDHDLRGRQSSRDEDTVMPVIDELVRAAREGQPYDIGVVYIHTSNPAGASRMRALLTAAGYRVQRHHGRIWVHSRTEEQTVTKRGKP